MFLYCSLYLIDTMRYMSLELSIDWETFHPVEARLAQEPDIRRKAMHSVKIVDDTIAVLTETEGDLDRYREVLCELPEVRRFAVSGNESGYCYAQMEPTAASIALLEGRNEGDFIIEMPMIYTNDGGLRMTIIGEEADLLTVPDQFGDVDIRLLSTGPYLPDADGVFAALTDRQQEVLKTAIQQGYYENPREATLADLASELAIDRGTVGKHLRTIESKVFAEYVL